MCPPLEACTLHGKSLFKTENAIQALKGGKVLYTCDVTVSQRKGLDISAECSVNLGFMGKQRAQAFVVSASERWLLTTEG